MEKLHINKIMPIPNPPKDKKLQYRHYHVDVKVRGHPVKHFCVESYPYVVDLLTEFKNVDFVNVKTMNYRYRCYTFISVPKREN